MSINVKRYFKNSIKTQEADENWEQYTNEVPGGKAPRSEVEALRIVSAKNRKQKRCKMLGCYSHVSPVSPDGICEVCKGIA